MTLKELLSGYNVDVTVNLKISEKEYQRKPTRSEVREVEDLLEDFTGVPVHVPEHCRQTHRDLDAYRKSVIVRVLS